jgi:hypothetical protein
MQSLRIVYAEFMQCLRRVYAMFTQGLCRVYAKVYAMFTQMFTQRLRKVYAGLRSSGTCCLLRKPFQVFLSFTQGLRRFTHIVRKPKYVYAEFTQVYAAYVGLRRGQFADEGRRTSGRSSGAGRRND